jgi:PHP domain-containing protein
LRQIQAVVEASGEGQQVQCLPLLLAPALALVRSPHPVYAAMAADPPLSSALAWLRRPLLAALAIGVSVALSATGHLTLALVASTTLSWFFVVVAQVAIAAAVLAPYARSGIELRRALDLFFASHVPWSLTLLLFAALTAVTSPIGRGGGAEFLFALSDRGDAAHDRGVLRAGPPARSTPRPAADGAAPDDHVGRARRGVFVRRAILAASSRVGGVIVRTVAAAAFVTGLTAGTFAQLHAIDLPSTVRQRGGYAVVAADLHVHSFPGDGALPVWDIAREARRLHIDAVALTNHNQMHSWELWLRVPHPRDGALIIPGDEVTSRHYHIAAVGLSYPIGWDQSAAPAARAIEAQGGVAIAAHPIGRYGTGIDADALRALDGIEAAHPVMELNEKAAREMEQAYARAIAAHPAIAAIGSSDFHFFAPMGLCRTYVFTRAATEAGVLEAIRAGRTVACDARGGVRGPQPLASLVAEDCRADAAAPTLSRYPTLEHAATVLTWLALVGLILAGA